MTETNTTWLVQNKRTGNYLIVWRNPSGDETADLHAETSKRSEATIFSDKSAALRKAAYENEVESDLPWQVLPS